VTYGVDTNVLIYAHLASFAEHQKVHAFLLSQLNQPEVTLAVTPLVLHEFLHIVTDTKRFNPPLDMTEAITIVNLYLGRSNVDCLSVNQECLELCLQLLEQHRLGRKRIADTLFAATLLHHGVTQLITCNPGDFRIFEGLTLIDPR
jgi:toxin-antitoxin system PIN domain toxin